MNGTSGLHLSFKRIIISIFMTKNPHKNKLTRLGLLMAIAQVMLFVLVGIWLRGQYREEQYNLKNELSESFMNARQQVLDSMLVNDFINPLLANKEGFKIHVDSTNSIPRPGSVFEQKLKISSNFDKFSRDSIITVISDSDGTHNKNTVTFIHKNDSTKDFLLKGVKLIVKEVSTSDRNIHSIEQSIYANADTALFKNLVREDFLRKHWTFNTKWTAEGESDSSRTILPGSLLIKMKESPLSYGIMVSDFSVYILKKISPQIVFGLIMVAVTGLAFVFSYKSLRKQFLLNKLRADFIDNISHELKTPVSTVKVVVEALQDPDIRKQDIKTTEYLDMASREITRLESLIAKVLNTSLLGEEIQSLDVKELNLNELINEVITSFKIHATGSNAKITFSCSGENFIYSGDPVHLQGAILNILDNAIKYSGENPIVSVQLEQTNSGFSIYIRDNGPGIEEKYKDKIFDKFYRVPMDGGHTVKGHGLGLSYTATVIQQHGGTITVENMKEGGTCFQIHLPKVSK